MKNIFLFLFIMFISIYTIAQTTVPRAGEYLTTTPGFNPIRSGIPAAEQLTEIINFDSSNVSFKGNYPFADSYSLYLDDSGELAFVGSGGGIFVTDVSDPANPVILSEIRTRSLVDNCTYDPVSKRLYVCAYFSGIEIWDLSVLSNPVRMSRIPTEPYPRSGVVYVEDYIIFATNNSLWTVDAADPYNPIFVEELFLTNNLITQILLKDTVLYTVADIQGIKAINVTDPLDLRIIASTGYASGTRFAIEGNFLYAVKSGNLTILDISNPASIAFMSATAIENFPQDIAAANNKVYIAKQSTGGGLEIVNVENPSSPVILGIYNGNYRFVEVNNNYAYTTGYNTAEYSNFSVLNVTNPLAVAPVAEIVLPGFINDVAVSGNYAYTGSDGFRVIDISDSTHPVLTGYIDVKGSIVEASGDSIVIYCPNSMGTGNKVYTMDVTDPSNPAVLDFVSPPVMTVDLALKDKLAFVSCWWDGVRIYDFSNPSEFTAVSHVMGWVQGGVPGSDWCYVQGLAVDGNYLYLIDWGPFSNEDTYGLYIIDISNPAAPVLVKRFISITSVPQDIKVIDGIAYIADGTGGLEIVDVTNPNNPAVIGYFDLLDGATGVDVNGDYAYVSNYILGGVQVIDITDPTTPVSAGWYKPSGCFALNVEAKNGFIYVSDGLAGIQIYRNLLEPVTSVDQTNIILDDYELVSYPNPFNPEATLQLTLPQAGNYKISVYNSLGEKVTSIFDGHLQAGRHKFNFHASEFPSGIYFYQLESEHKYLSGKMVLLK